MAYEVAAGSYWASSRDMCLFLAIGSEAARTAVMTVDQHPGSWVQARDCLFRRGWISHLRNIYLFSSFLFQSVWLCALALLNSPRLYTAHFLPRHWLHRRAAFARGEYHPQVVPRRRHKVAARIAQRNLQLLACRYFLRGVTHNNSSHNISTPEAVADLHPVFFRRPHVLCSYHAREFFTGRQRNAIHDAD